MFDKKIYVAKKLGVEVDEYGTEIPYYDEAKEFHFSYMPTSGQVDYQIYGTQINNMFTAILDYNAYLGVFKSGDVAYLVDGETQNIDELHDMDINNKYKPNANYRVKISQPQNMRIKVIFEKIGED